MGVVECSYEHIRGIPLSGYYPYPCVAVGPSYRTTVIDSRREADDGP